MRVQIQLLLREARSGDLVVCDKLDRWSRDPEFTYGSIRKLLERGVKFYAVGDRCDPSTRDGDTMLGVRVLVAREEHKRIKERTVGTRRLLRDRGYWVEGHVPFGYQRPEKRTSDRLAWNVLREQGEHAKLVREIYRLCIRGQSIEQIAAAMPPIRRWDKKLVRGILRSRTYLGEIKNSDGVWVPGQHPAIVDADTYARAQEALDGRRQRGSRPQEDSYTRTWMLRQIGRCGQCGAKLGSAFGGWGKGYKFYYRCTHGCKPYRRVEPLDAEVSDLVLARLVELRAHLAGTRKRVAPATDHTAERERLRKKRERYLEAFADAGMTKAELRAALARVDEQRTRLDAKEAEQAREVSDDAVRAALTKIASVQLAWSRADAVTRRLVLHELATVVSVGPAGTVVTWRTPEEIAADEEM